MSVNSVILVGHLGNEPDVKYLGSGVAICRFSLATNETFKNKAGDLEKRTEWHSIVAFGRLGEVCSEYVTTGRQVYIEGSIRTGKWKDGDGNERKSYDIVARYMQMLSPSGNGTGPSQRRAALLLFLKLPKPTIPSGKTKGASSFRFEVWFCFPFIASDCFLNT